MAANVYLKELTLSIGVWSKLADTRTIVNAEIMLPAANTVDVSLRFRGGTSIGIPKGTQFPLKGVDLSDLEASASVASQKIIVVGYSR